MEEIASLSDIDENDIVQYIIDGIQDVSSNKALLYTANTIDYLKDVLRKYEKMKMSSSSYNRPSLSSVQKSFEKMQINNGSSNQGVPKCYNCSESGHVSKWCTKPKRKVGSCFRCGKPDHYINECPVKPTVGNLLSKPELNSYPDIETNGKQNEFEHLINFTFLSEQQENFTAILNTLIDSGSPISFVQEKFVAPYGYEKVKYNHHEYYGINNSPLEIIGTVYCNIFFENDFIDFCLYVVKNFTMNHNVILGRDFLKLNNFTLSKHVGSNTNASSNAQQFQPQLENIQDTDEAYQMENVNFVSDILNINILDLNTNLPIKINQNLPANVRMKIEDIVAQASFDTHLLKPTRTSSDVKLSIKLTRSDPFYCTARRLPFSHKEELKKILDDLLQRNVIRESNSPFASPIVLVQKKK